MKLQRKPLLIAYGVGFAIALGVALLEIQSGHGIAWLICDGCFVAAVMVGGFGGLLYAAYHGVFDIFSFGVKSVLHLHWPGLSFGKQDAKRDEIPEDETFADYRIRKSKSRHIPWELLLAGATYLAIAIVLVMIV